MGIFEYENIICAKKSYVILELNSDKADVYITLHSVGYFLNTRQLNGLFLIHTLQEGTPPRWTQLLKYKFDEKLDLKMWIRTHTHCGYFGFCFNHFFSLLSYNTLESVYF